MLTPLRRLLCIAETLNPSASWLIKAETLTRGCGATLELCAADVEHFISASWATQSGEAEYRAALAARRRQDLVRLVQPLRMRGLDVTAGMLLPAPLERSVLAHVATSHPDLVIKSTQHAPSVPMAVLLQTDWTLTHALSAPLLLVGSKPWPDLPVVATIGADDIGAGGPTVTVARRLCAALAGTFDGVPARWSDIGRLIDYLHNRGVSVVAMQSADVRTDVAARILEQLDADLLLVPSAPRPPHP